MNAKSKLLAGVVSAALLAGCASSGGGGGGAPMNVDTREEQLLCMLTLGLCALFPDLGSPAEPVSSSTDGSNPSVPTVPFTKWSELPRGAQTQARSLTGQISYKAGSNGVVDTISTSSVGEGTERVQRDGQGNLQSFGSHPFAATTKSLAAVGHAGIDFGEQQITGGDSLPLLPSLPTRSVGVIANPYVLGWEYQSFGIWNDAYSASGVIQASSFGAPTPGSAVPTSGSATFSGKLAGSYISAAGQQATAAADLSVSADFGSRSLNISSRNTAITRDARSATAAPNLDVKGTLSYSPGSSSFSGSLTNSGATMSGSSKGQFYGPAAQELGGVFSLRSGSSVEAFTGAYGAKR